MEPWDLDHLLGREGGDWGPVALAHRRCNRADGAERAKASRRARRIERHLAIEAERQYWLEVNAARAPPSAAARSGATLDRLLKEDMVARCGLLALRDPDDETGIQRLLAVAKCNGVREEEKVTVRYTIAPHVVEADGQRVEVGRVEWGDDDPRRADALVHAADQPDAIERADAGTVMREALADGPMTARQLEELRRDSGIGTNTWERERGRLHRAGVIRKDQPGKEGAKGGGEVVWSLGIRSHGTSHGSESHGSESGAENPHASTVPEQVQAFGPMSPMGRGANARDPSRCNGCGRPWPGPGMVCDPCLERERWPPSP